MQYGGLPADVVVDGGHVWQEQEDGGAFVNGEPHNGTAWLPLNDHPADKASYDISVTVPRGWEAVAPGDLVGQSSGAHHEHLALAGGRRDAELPGLPRRGPLRLRAWRRPRHPDQPAGVLLVVRSEAGAADPRPVPRPARLPATGWSRHLGRYPFDHLGMVAQDGEVATLESQTSPVYGRYIFQFGFPDQARSTILHELAHQWFASSVTIRRWRDLWLNEGFATFVQGWYAADHGGRDHRATASSTTYAAHPAGTLYWTVASGRPGPGSTQPVPHRLQPRRDDARRPAHPDRRAGVRAGAATVGRRAPPRLRDHRRVRRPRRGGQRPGPRDPSSGSGSTTPTGRTRRRPTASRPDAQAGLAGRSPTLANSWP